MERVAVWRIFALATVSAAIDLGYAVEGSYITPYLLAAELPLKYASLALSLSPFLGLLFQAYIGSVSDECICSCGRRRPFIVLFGVTAAASIGLAPCVFYMHHAVTGLSVNAGKTVTMVAAVACFVVFDFSINALTLPARTYLLDSVPLHQVLIANYIYDFFAGLGATLGYSLCGLRWSYVLGLNNTLSIPHQVSIVFRIVAVVTLICVLVTISSVGEKSTKFKNLVFHSRSGCNWSPFDCLKRFATSFVDIYRFTSHMSCHMWLVCLWMLLASLGMFSFDYFFTTFMGEVVYQGDSQASASSGLYHKYSDGVRMGSWALALAAFISVILALLLDSITRLIRLKTVFIFSLGCFVLCCGLLYTAHDVTAVMLLVSSSYGPFLALLFTVPYSLIPIYQVLLNRLCEHFLVTDKMY